MVSICIASYNGEKYIERQIESIIYQIKSDDEVIVSDDGSTDKTIDIIKSFKDKRIKLIKNNSGKHGVKSNFEYALNHCKGDYIFLADQDDVWMPNKYEIMMQYLKYYDLVHCNSIITDEELDEIKFSFYEILNNGSGIIKNIKKSTYYGSHMAFKRSILTKSIPFPNSNEVGHDLWIGLVAEMNKSRVLFVDEKLMYYRRHDDALCKIGSKSKRPFLIKLWGRVIIFYYCLRYMIFKMFGGKVCIIL